jgi:pimeloyl-ACP methyl ester carboxylesterase
LGADAAFAGAENLRIFGVTNVPSVSVLARNPRYVAVYLHGNAENLLTCGWYARFLSQALSADVYVPEYSGYWQSGDGDWRTATEKNCFEDIELFVGELVAGERRTGRNLPILMCGYSTGCALALHASDVHRTDSFPHAVFLMAPFISACSVVLASRGWQIALSPLYSFVDAFCMRTAAMRAGHPMVIAHGLLDRVVPVTHGRQIARWSSTAQKDNVVYLEVDTADHDNIRDQPVVYDQFLEFLNILGADKEDA